MQYEEGSLGRVFVLRLEEGDRLPGVVEYFARDHGIRSAMVIFLGGAADGSRMVVGPEENREETIIPITHVLQGIQEVLALGTIYPTEAGDPMLHLHAASGRDGGATVGCTRPGVDVWLVGEVVILEIQGTKGLRARDPRSGFKLLAIPSSA